MQWDELFAQVRLLQQEGALDEAILTAQKAMTVAEQEYGSEHPNVAAALNLLAQLYREQGNFADAMPLLERALSIQMGSKGFYDPATEVTLNHIGAIQVSIGNYAEAEQIYSQIVDIAEDVFGPVSDEVAKASNDLGLVYFYEGNYKYALPLFDRALDILESSEELDLCIANPELPGSILNNKALVYIEQGVLEAAIAILQQALHFDEKTLGEDHPAVARDLTHLAEAYKRQEEFGQADAASRWATAVSEENKDRKSYFQTHKIDAEL